MASHFSFLNDVTQNLPKGRKDINEDRRHSMRRRDRVVDLEEEGQLSCAAADCVSIGRSWSFSEQHLDLGFGSFPAILCMTSELRK